MQNTNKKTSPISYIAWFGLLVSTFIPIKSMINWYEVMYRAQVGQIKGPINAGASEILSIIRNNLGAFFLHLTALGSRSLFKWTLICFIFVLFLSGILKLPVWLYNFWDRLIYRLRNISPKRLLISILLLTIITTALLSYQAHWFYPDYPDNVVQLYQAKLFKEGKLSIDPPPFGIDFFWYPLIITNADRWYPRYEPGHAIMLMLGLFFGAAWLVNPILGALSLVIAYKLGREVYDGDTALLGLVLLFISPFFLTVSSGFLNNATSMFFSILGIFYFVKTIKYPKLSYPFLCGLFLGAIANVRPFTAFLVALPLGMYMLYLLFKEPKVIFPKMTAVCIGLSITISMLLYYNYLQNGHPLLFGQTAMIGKKLTTLGFGKSLYGINNTPFRSGVRLLGKLNGLNFSLSGWPIPSLAFIFLFFWPGFYDNKKKNWDYLFLAVILTMIAGYYFFFALKVRYLYDLAPLLLLLSARGIFYLYKKLEKAGFTEFKIKQAIYAIAPIFIVYMLYTSIIPQLHPNGKHKHLIYRLVTQKDIHNAIIFLPPGFSGWGIYGRGFVHNDPEFKGDVIYAHNRGKDNKRLMEYYPGRSYYFFDLKDNDEYTFSEIKPENY